MEPRSWLVRCVMLVTRSSTRACTRLPEQIVETAIQEDADLIGLSVLSGAHMTLFRKLIELLAERDAADIVVFGGGIVPEEDIPVLEEMGVAKVFTPGAPTGEITGWVAEHFADDADRPDPGGVRRARCGPVDRPAGPPGWRPARR